MLKFLLGLFVGFSLTVSAHAASSIADSYQVFRGDGFSFRYPINWEAGLPQLESSKALVRAVPSTAGYAASCSVSVAPVRGLDRFTQAELNDRNHQNHDFAYLTRIREMHPDMKVLSHSTSTFFSNQPASSITFDALIRGQTESATNRFFQIMTIRKPNRYVMTCRGTPQNFDKAKADVDLIVGTFFISWDPSYR